VRGKQAMTENNRILVIDDNPEIHKDFNKILGNGKNTEYTSALDALTYDILGEKAPIESKHAYQIDFAQQGKEGIDKIQQALSENKPYAVVFTDIRMPPGLDGIETIQQLWQIDKEIQTVIITAYSDYNWQQINQSLGTSDRLLILKKPFENIEIRQMALSLCKKWQLNKNMQQAHQQLLDSEQRYIDLYDKSPDMYISCAVDTGKILQCNQTIADKLGYAKAELIGRSLFEFIFTSSIDKTQYNLILKSEPEHTTNLDIQIVGKNGIPIDVNLSINVENNSEDNIPFSRICLIDLSHKKKMEKAHVMESIATLSAGIAHDFNNILAIISGNLDLLALTMDSEESLPRIESIRTSIKRATNLTWHLIKASNQYSPPLSLVDINLEIIKLKAQLNPLIQENITFGISTADKLWKAKINSADFSNTMINLVSNACEAMEDKGGKLTLKIKNITLDDEYCTTHDDTVPGEYIRIKIKDTGKGMDKAQKEHIYEPFYTTHEFGQNRGLGLSMVYGFVKSSGGYIECHSKYKKGTTFIIYLPRSE